MRIPTCYNGASIYLHIKIINEKTIPFTGLCIDPNWILISIIFLLIHGLSLPSLLHRRPWIRRKNSRKNMILNKLPDRSVTYADSFFDFLRTAIFLVLSGVAGATMGTVFLISLLNLADSASRFSAITIWTIIFLLLVIIGIWGIRYENQKRRTRL